ncbi:protein FAR1-RELATED SEQUENCE 5-like [Salvia miltiorrhiza]|uniref:protein FAR1-RELATED SEQUENCE 5-like n=1 Tax=Salvia miltiorrhiza TaxID=226208 RepID=UPI0025AC0C86|nr:protein FAR1-RELATED SEQUENCE 5-like [Salvia miltiorrhiza]
MEKESGGPQNCGFTRKDAYNHINGLKMKTKVENGDATWLVQYFTTKANSEPFFYWDFQLDDDGHLMNFFFRDSRSSLDYEYFGDVLSVDSTYRTNKYKLVCVPFVGVNHHLKNVLFGLGFLSDETTRSYEWLLTTFWTSMSAKEPEVIFTDQCQSLMNAIDSVFLTSSHRLCQWHINQNAPSHFGKLNGSATFKRAWFHCMNGCDTETEFEEAWKAMIDEYGLGEHRWFNTMYRLKKRWSSAFTNHRFCAGLHATSRSEVTNKVLKTICSASTSLHDFVFKFDEIQIEWRRKESEEDALCIGMPGLYVDHNELMKNAAKVLTRSVFRKFEHEAKYSLNVDIIKGPSKYDSDDLEFIVSSGCVGGKQRHIQFNKESYLSTCTCRLFETAGYLCSHIFKIYYLMNVKNIPKQYLLKRFSRAAKERILTNVSSGIGVPNDSDLHVSSLAFVNHLMRMTYDLGEYAKLNCDKRGLIMTRLTSLCEEVYGSRNDHNGSPRDHQEVPKGDGSKGVQNASARECHELPKRAGSNGVENASAREQDELPKRVASKAAETNSASKQHELPKGGVAFRNPKVAKTRGEKNSEIIRHWDRTKSCKIRGSRKRKFDQSQTAPSDSNAILYETPSLMQTWDSAFEWTQADARINPTPDEVYQAQLRRFMNIHDNEARINLIPSDNYQALICFCNLFSNITC